jgi:RNA polymerase sigma factor (sigma-70 family)
MKTTATPATEKRNPKAFCQGRSDVKTASCRRSTKAPSAGGGRKRTAHNAAVKRLTADDVFETDAYSCEDVFRIYLNQIGATQLLSREQEAALGHRIRTGFNDLLQHLLSSGCVAHILLEQAQAEMARKSCQPARRLALAGMLTRAEALLSSAENRFVSGAVENTALNADVAAVFRELVPALGIRPDQSLELLARVGSEVSELFAKDSTELGAPLRWEFERKNLMDWNTCEAFLAEAARLRAAVIAARNEMVGANLRLVVSEAKKMKHAFLSVEDLVQEGNCGLIMAAERFDERLGHRFSTFAVKLIKSAMRRENDNQGRTIRLPVHRCDALRKMEDASARLEAQLHRPASVEQIAEETGFACSDVRELTVFKQCTVSLDLKIGDEEELTLEAFLADPGSLTPFYGDCEIAGVLDPYLRYLDDAQHNVVAFMYGIGGRPQLSLEATAQTLGLNRSDVRRLHQLALESLRNALREGGVPLGYARAA